MEKKINVLNSCAPEDCETGDTILLRVTEDKTGEGMFMEFGSIVVRKNHLRARFNKHRKNGYIPGLRRAWEPCTMEDIKDEFNIDLLDLEPEIDQEGREFYTLNVLHPMSYNSQTGEMMRLCVQINETTKPTEKQSKNWRKKAKRINDEYFKHEGKLIFANTSIVYGRPNHVYLEHDLPEYMITDSKIINSNQFNEEPELMKDTEMKGSFLD